MHCLTKCIAVAWKKPRFKVLPSIRHDDQLASFKAKQKVLLSRASTGNYATAYMAKALFFSAHTWLPWIRKCDAMQKFCACDWGKFVPLFTMGTIADQSHAMLCEKNTIYSISKWSCSDTQY